MKKLMKRLSKVADSSQYFRLRSNAAADPYGGRSCAVPGGHLPVYVGEEMERFVVSADLLNHPIFVKLLNRTAAEYGYAQKGVLRIPCHVCFFQRVLEALRQGGEERDLQEMLNTLSTSEGY